MNEQGHRDRELIAKVITREMKSRPEIRGNVSALARRAGMHRATLKRALAADENTRSQTYSGIEIGLSLPTDSLLMVGAHDWAGLIEEGVDPMLVDWIRREVSKSADTIAKVADGS